MRALPLVQEGLWHTRLMSVAPLALQLSLPCSLTVCNPDFTLLGLLAGAIFHPAWTSSLFAAAPCSYTYSAHTSRWDMWQEAGEVVVYTLTLPSPPPTRAISVDIRLTCRFWVEKIGEPVWCVAWCRLGGVSCAAAFASDWTQTTLCRETVASLSRKLW